MEGRSPYSPPASAVDVYVEQKGAPWKAVLLGLLIDIGGSIVSSVLIVMVSAMVMASNGMDQREIQNLFAGPERSLPVSVALYVMGGLFSVLGGFVCARIVKQNELKWGGIMAAISTLIGLVIGGNRHESVMALFLYVVGFVATLMGAWLGMKRNQRLRSKA